MLADRVHAVSPSATMALAAKVSEARRQGADLIALNVGEPDFGTPAHICAAAKDAIDRQKTKYTPLTGIWELRQAICKKLSRDNGLTYQPEEICVGAGAKQPLSEAVLALCQGGDQVLIPTPSWVSYAEMVKLSGATPVPIPCREQDGYQLDLAGIRAAITPHTKAILLNTPNNPTGTVYTRDSLEELVSLAEAHNFYLISDEVYEKLIYDGARHVSPASLSPAAKARTVLINGVSKAYAMTGWRIGYAAAPKEIIDGIAAIQSHTTACAGSVAQYAALAALDGPQECLFEMVRAFDARRRFLLDRLNAMPHVCCPVSKGAFYLLPNVEWYYQMRWKDALLSDSFGLAEYLLEQALVAVVPGAAFAAPGCLRISYSNSMDNLSAAMDRMERALAQLVSCN